MFPERIEREIVIDAPLEVVWAVVTELRRGTPTGLGARLREYIRQVRASDRR